MKGKLKFGDIVRDLKGWGRTMMWKIPLVLNYNMMTYKGDSTILSTFIKLPFAIKIFVLSIFE